MAKKKKKTKNVIMAIVSKEDPKRYQSRTVKPEIGKGRKDRPRDNKVISPGDLPLKRKKL